MSRVVLVDMDNTLVDFDKTVHANMAQRYPTHFRSERTTYEIESSYPEWLGVHIREMMTECGFFLNLEPMDGAIDAVHDMMANGIHVFFCTSPLTVYQNCVPEKYAWIEKHLGPEWVRRLILTKDKTVVRGNYLIDDMPQIKGSLEPEWEHVLFDQPYNRDVPSRRRLLNWRNWRCLFEHATA